MNVRQLKKCDGLANQKADHQLWKRRIPLKIFRVVLALLSVCALSGAQQQTSSLQIGLVKVRLGMLKTELQNEISGTGEGDAVVHRTGDKLGNNVFVITENMWNIGTPRGDDHAGDIRFRNGRVVYADREWLLKDSDAVDAILGAIDSFQQGGLHACVISRDTLPDPDATYERAWIDCGARRLLITKAKIKGQEFRSITESIGSIPLP
jgi:hypothetical protein